MGKIMTSLGVLLVQRNIPQFCDPQMAFKSKMNNNLNQIDSFSMVENVPHPGESCRLQRCFWCTEIADKTMDTALTKQQD